MTDPSQSTSQTKLSDTKKLGLVFTLLALLFALETAGASKSGSLALLADATHILFDLFTVGLSLLAAVLTSRQKRAHRVETWVALFNGMSLLLMTVWVMFSAFKRFGASYAVQGETMALIGGLGMAINMGSIWILERGDSFHGLNLRSVFLHLITDVVGTAGSALSGLIIWQFQTFWLDSAVSLVIGGFIFYHSLKLIRDCIYLLRGRKETL